jgi:hypothetical protein
MVRSSSSHDHLQRHPVGAILVLIRPDAHDGPLKALPAAEPVHIPPRHPPVIFTQTICMLTVCPFNHVQRSGQYV